jgi:hypothetical protein
MDVAADLGAQRGRRAAGAGGVDAHGFLLLDETWREPTIRRGGTERIGRNPKPDPKV